MKIINLLFSLLFIICITSLYSQEIYKSYYNEFADKNYNINITYNEFDEYLLFIEMTSFDESNPNGGILISNGDHQIFLDTLQTVLIKYEEWIQVANDNKITKFQKKLKASSEPSGLFKIKNTWYAQNVIKLTYNFKVDSINHILYLLTNTIVSSDNYSISHEGFILVFLSPVELEYFINILDPKKVNYFLNHPKISDLFKD